MNKPTTKTWPSAPNQVVSGSSPDVRDVPGFKMSWRNPRTSCKPRGWLGSCSYSAWPRRHWPLTWCQTFCPRQSKTPTWKHTSLLRGGKTTRFCVIAVVVVASNTLVYKVYCCSRNKGQVVCSVGGEIYKPCVSCRKKFKFNLNVSIHS